MRENGAIKKTVIIITAIALFLSLLFFLSNRKDIQGDGFNIAAVYTIDRRYFTQGLASEDGFFYIGTGLYGQSSLMKMEISTGRIVAKRSLPNEYFGEGITIWGDKVIQLTWRERKGLVYEKGNLKFLHEFPLHTEGWGIAHDDERLIVSDGSAALYFLDPETFKVTGHIIANEMGREIKGLNELEYIKGMIYANVYPTDRIAVISPQSGRVEGWIDLGELSMAHKGAGVLNGIAYDSKTDRLFVTGKLWGKIYEIQPKGRDGTN